MALLAWNGIASAAQVQKVAKKEKNPSWLLQQMRNTTGPLDIKGVAEAFQLDRHTASKYLFTLWRNGDLDLTKRGGRNIFFTVKRPVAAGTDFTKRTEEVAPSQLGVDGLPMKTFPIPLAEIASYVKKQGKVTRSMVGNHFSINKPTAGEYLEQLKREGFVIARPIKGILVYEPYQDPEKLKAHLSVLFSELNALVPRDLPLREFSRRVHQRRPLSSYLTEQTDVNADHFFERLSHDPDPFEIFNIEDAAARYGINPKTVSTYVRMLEAEGRLEQVKYLPPAHFQFGSRSAVVLARLERLIREGERTGLSRSQVETLERLVARLEQARRGESDSARKHLTSIALELLDKWDQLKRVTTARHADNRLPPE